MKLFGTDGIRARYGTAPLDETTIVAIGRAVGSLLTSRGAANRLVLAGDTRESTPALARHLVRGLGRHVEVAWGDVLPTPAVALLTRTTGSGLGIVLSASHNPFHDNGIKFFNPDGFKFDDAQEADLEARIQHELDTGDRAQGPEALEVDVPAPDPALYATYLDALAPATETGALHGMRVVLDTGHGAAFRVAPDAFERLGADVHVLCNEPNGRNINDACGSTAPEKAAGHVRAKNARIGFAFDGDADRVIVIDENGDVRDGDELLVVLARAALARNGLNPRTIVATSMSNLGLERALRTDGITVDRCDVGDRAVVAMLRARGLRIGGEQSGHLVDLLHSTTGDGVRTALEIARIVHSSGHPFAALAHGFTRYPQTLINVPVQSKPDFEEVPAVLEALTEAKRELQDRGRIVLRYSGTEPLARVMVEADDEALVADLGGRIAAVLAAELG